MHHCYKCSKLPGGTNKNRNGSMRKCLRCSMKCKHNKLISAEKICTIVSSTQWNCQATRAQSDPERQPPQDQPEWELTPPRPKSSWRTSFNKLQQQWSGQNRTSEDQSLNGEMCTPYTIKVEDKNSATTSHSCHENNSEVIMIYPLAKTVTINSYKCEQDKSAALTKKNSNCCKEKIYSTEFCGQRVSDDIICRENAASHLNNKQSYISKSKYKVSAHTFQTNILEHERRGDVQKESLVKQNMYSYDNMYTKVEPPTSFEAQYPQILSCTKLIYGNKGRNSLESEQMRSDETDYNCISVRKDHINSSNYNENDTRNFLDRNTYEHHLDDIQCRCSRGTAHEDTSGCNRDRENSIVTEISLADIRRSTFNKCGSRIMRSHLSTDTDTRMLERIINNTNRHTLSKSLTSNDFSGEKDPLKGGVGLINDDLLDKELSRLSVLDPAVINMKKKMFELNASMPSGGRTIESRRNTDNMATLSGNNMHRASVLNPSSSNRTNGNRAIIAETDPAIKLVEEINSFHEDNLNYGNEQLNDECESLKANEVMNTRVLAPTLNAYRCPNSEKSKRNSVVSIEAVEKLPNRCDRVPKCTSRCTYKMDIFDEYPPGVLHADDFLQRDDNNEIGIILCVRRNSPLYSENYELVQAKHSNNTSKCVCPTTQRNGAAAKKAYGSGAINEVCSQTAVKATPTEDANSTWNLWINSLLILCITEYMWYLFSPNSNY